MGGFSRPYAASERITATLVLKREVSSLPLIHQYLPVDSKTQAGSKEIILDGQTT